MRALAVGTACVLAAFLLGLVVGFETHYGYRQVRIVELTAAEHEKRMKTFEKMLENINRPKGGDPGKMEPIRDATITVLEFAPSPFCYPPTYYPPRMAAEQKVDLRDAITERFYGRRDQHGHPFQGIDHTGHPADLPKGE